MENTTNTKETTAEGEKEFDMPCMSFFKKFQSMFDPCNKNCCHESMFYKMCFQEKKEDSQQSKSECNCHK